MATLTAREFNHDVSAAKRAADREPVIITDRGQPSHVLMSIEEFERLTRSEPDLIELIGMEDDDIAFDPAPLQLNLQLPRW